MLAHLEVVQDPHEPDIKVVTVVVPENSPIFNNISLQTSKLPDAAQMMKEQFRYHTQKRSQSRDFHDRTSDFNSKAFDGPMVSAIKRAAWADKTLAVEPGSLQDQLGLYHFAPH